MMVFFQDMKYWRHQFELLLTEIRDKKREEEKKNADTKQGSDKENKGNEKTAPSLAAGTSHWFVFKWKLFRLIIAQGALPYWKIYDDCDYGSGYDGKMKANKVYKL